VPGDGVGQVGGAVAVVDERLAGELPLPGGPVRTEQAPHYEPVVGDGLDPQDVAVGQGPSRLVGLDAMVISAADNQVPSRRLGTLGDPDRRAVVDEAQQDRASRSALAGSKEGAGPGGSGAGTGGTGTGPGPGGGAGPGTGGTGSGGIGAGGVGSGTGGVVIARRLPAVPSQIPGDAWQITRAFPVMLRIA